MSLPFLSVRLGIPAGDLRSDLSHTSVCLRLVDGVYSAAPARKNLCFPTHTTELIGYGEAAEQSLPVWMTPTPNAVKAARNREYETSRENSQRGSLDMAGKKGRRDFFDTQKFAQSLGALIDALPSEANRQQVASRLEILVQHLAWRVPCNSSRRRDHPADVL